MELRRLDGELIFEYENQAELIDRLKNNKSNLGGANLYGAYLKGVDLIMANLKGANLKGANLKGANLKGSNLKGANLKGSNLKGSNLKGSDLEGANLKGANLYGAYLKGTKIPIFCKWDVSIMDGSIIKIGCEERSILDWDKFFNESNDEIETSRGHEDFKRIRAMYEAHKKYIEILNS